MLRLLSTGVARVEEDTAGERRDDERPVEADSVARSSGLAALGGRCFCCGGSTGALALSRCCSVSNVWLIFCQRRCPCQFH